MSGVVARDGYPADYGIFSRFFVGQKVAVLRNSDSFDQDPDLNSSTVRFCNLIHLQNRKTQLVLTLPVGKVG